MSIRTPVLGLLGAAVVSATAAAAELSGVTLKDDAIVVLLSGDIAEGDADAAEALIRAVNDRGRLISAVRLDSPGGSLAEAVKLTELIRRAKLPTIVAAGARCASACFIVFAAGIDKFASYDAAIGVHGVSDKFGHETARTEAATISMARIASTFGVPPRIIGQMIATPARDIAWLTPDDLRAMGAIMTGRQVRSAPPMLTDDPQLAALDLQPPEATALPSVQADRRDADATAAAGRGDYSDAIRLWRQTADAGDGMSQYNLARMYAAGHGVTRDLAKAATWYHRAAERGIAHARLSLGIAYALGRGVPPDLLQAYRWLDLAASAYTADQDRRRALKARDLVAVKMTLPQIDEAQRLAREWNGQRGADHRKR
ncbi:hypothetical protein [Bradyrhizobium sp. WD16]|uniref:hypothetical protein n=1 Tax=Bradyrhizobium sp. WD16 TaxID=1521768 RepID=UPI0020A428F3|nr:hypothetical protein [Bradyrhizobium sp. WD16]UTD29742.1 hypothetical protein DB459_25375 [Bradyrhizobium sp. WD16]